jgi:hypothetical protein
MKNNKQKLSQFAVMYEMLLEYSEFIKEMGLSMDFMDWRIAKFNREMEKKDD